VAALVDRREEVTVAEVVEAFVERLFEAAAGFDVSSSSSKVSPSGTAGNVAPFVIPRVTIAFGMDFCPAVLGILWRVMLTVFDSFDFVSSSSSSSKSESL
jgi:hypothetical protein